MFGARQKQCSSIRECGSSESNVMPSDVAEILFESSLLESSDEESIQGEQTSDQASEDRADWDQASRPSTPEQRASGPEGRPSRAMNWHSAMQSLTMTAVHVLNLERDMFDLSRDVAAFVRSASFLETMTFEIPMGPLLPSAAADEDSIAYLTIDEVLQLALYIPQMRIVSQTISLKEKLASDEWRGWFQGQTNNDQDEDDESAVVDEEKEQLKRKFVYNVALVASMAGHLEDLVSIVLPKWRRMMAQNISSEKDAVKAAIIEEFVASVFRWAADYAARADGSPSFHEV